MHGFHAGESPDRRAIAVAGANGVVLDDLVARKVEREDFGGFDLILAMDQGHYDDLNGKKPDGAAAMVVMFLDFVGNDDVTEVPDPYYGGEEDFRYVFDLVDEGSRVLLEKIKTEFL